MSISKEDEKYIWHPLNQHKTNRASIALTKAKGVYLYDENKKKYLDGIASWYTAMYGHCNPIILKQVQQQLNILNQVVFSGFTHKPAVDLSKELMTILPPNQAKVFFSDNGSTAVEVGIKMALQYFANQKIKKHKIIGLENGFHGDTFGAMMTSGKSIFNEAFIPFLPQIERIPPPTNKNISHIITHLKQYIATNNVAAFIYEPLVQGAAGMQMYDAEGLNKVLKLCKENNIITIADEVMTGFGKTGSYFASDYMETKPDIICLSKALSAGVVPLAVTTCTQQIYNAFYADEIEKSFFHAHTYSANPVACVAAIEGIKLLKSPDIQEKIKKINKLHKQFIKTLNSFDTVKNIRVKGVILAFDLSFKQNTKTYGEQRDKIFRFFMDRGIYTRPLGNTLYFVPPYVIEEAELDLIYTTVLDFLRNS